MLSKVAVVGIVIVVAIAGTFYFGVTERWEEGAPPAQFTVILTEPSSGNQWEGTINVNKETIGTITGSKTLLRPAGITAQLVGVDPEADYEVELIITYEADLPEDAPPDTILYGDVTVTGKVDYPPGTERFFYSTAFHDHPHPEIKNMQLNPPDYEGIAEFTKADGLHWDKTFVDPVIYPLKGAHLDGSQWVCTIETSTAFAGTDAFFGQTIITITMILDTEGNINIVVTNVDVTAPEV